MRYHPDTPREVRDIIEKYLHTDVRLRLFYGDPETGRDWNEIFGVIGTIGRSTAWQEENKIPLLISRKNALGGPGILTHCIVRITINGRDVYRHPRYTPGEFYITPCPDKDMEAWKNVHFVVWRVEPEAASKIVWGGATEQKAKSFIAFLKGERNRA